ncbi:alanine racemase [Conexibacter sp. CPCC 206217]|uniref:alanine racemase n=1 Tax=Conexibacter sp. CPCC 206217 TaxID=3064574 RepID=UPI0027254F05|nr:alanine racemase [Conexibacter sp. CPCC 206217]MDO8213553.1 alanine racemase [Conexibacter sp. CPCC 206217]
MRPAALDRLGAAVRGRTPALVVNVEALERNLATMQTACTAAGRALRPHVKGHKSPWIAHAQLRHGAVGVCAATLAEAQTMVGGGVTDLHLTSALAPAKLGALFELAAVATVSVVVDDVAQVEALAVAGAGSRNRVGVLIELDAGQDRAGAAPGQLVAIAAGIASSPALELVGVQAYEGHLQQLPDAAERRLRAHAAYDAAAACVHELQQAGHPVQRVTCAGTGTLEPALDHSLPTEVQPGSYALADASYRAAGVDRYEQAAFVIASVLGVRPDATLIVDAGVKAVSGDLGPAAVAFPPGAAYTPAGDEHGRVAGGAHALRTGDLVALVPSHSDTTVCLHRRFVVVTDDGHDHGTLPIGA